MVLAGAELTVHEVRDVSVVLEDAEGRRVEIPPGAVEIDISDDTRVIRRDVRDLVGMSEEQVEAAVARFEQQFREQAAIEFTVSRGEHVLGNGPQFRPIAPTVGPNRRQRRALARAARASR